MAIKSFYTKPKHSNSVIDSMVIGKSDQRGFIRMDIESEVNFKIPGDKNVYSGVTKDLSASGVRFVTEKAVNVGDLLAVSIKPKIDITPPLEVTLVVIRVTALEESNLYDVAGEIRQPDA